MQLVNRQVYRLFRVFSFSMLFSFLIVPVSRAADKAAGPDVVAPTTVNPHAGQQKPTQTKAGVVPGTVSGAARRLAVRQRADAMPLQFYPDGSNGAATRYVARGLRYGVEVGEGGFRLTMRKAVSAPAAPAGTGAESGRGKASAGMGAPPSPTAPSYEVESEQVEFLGASCTAKLEPLNPTESYANFFVGRDPAKWRTHVSGYGRVRYRDLYPGVDLIFHG